MSRSIKGITIELDGETTGLEKALSDVNQRSREVQTELNKVERLLRFNPGNTELVAQEQQLLSERVETTRDKLQQLKDAQDEVTAAFQRGEISEEQYRAFQRELVETESKLKHFESQLEQTQTKWEKFGEKAADAGERMKHSGEKMQRAGTELTKKVTAPLAGVAAAAIKVGTDFETSMSEVAAISGATGDDLQSLEDKAREMGATTNKSASESADAMGYLALAGWDTNEMLTGIEPVLKLSSAGNLDLARTAELVTNSMGAMGIEVHELNDYLDVMAKTSQSADTDIDQLGEAFITAGGKLRDLGIDFEEGAIALGLMADAGIKGSEAGRGLSAILTNLTHPTGQTKKAMEELGISVFDSNGEFIGIEESLQKVDGALAGMTQEQQNSYKSMIAGKEHAKTFSALMNGLGDGYDSLREEVNGANGALDEMYDIMTDNLAGRWDEFKSALEEAGIAIFKNLQPALETALGLLKGLVDAFNAIPGPIQGFIVAAGAILGVVGPILASFGWMYKHIGILLTALPSLIGWFGKLGSVFTFIKGAATFVAGAFGAITAPVWAVIAGITALVAAGVALYKNWDEVKEFAGVFWEYLVEGFTYMKDVLVEFFTETIPEAFGGFVEFFVEGFETVSEWLITFFTETVPEYFGMFIEFISELPGQVMEFLNQLFIEDIPYAVGYGIGFLVDKVSEGLDKMVEFFRELPGRVYEFVAETFNNIVEFAGNMREKAIETGREFLNNVIKFVQQLPGRMREFTANIINNVTEWASNMRQKAIEAGTNFLNNVIDYVQKLPGRVREFLSNTVSNIVSFAKNAKDEALKAGKNIFDSIVDTVKEIPGQMLSLGGDIISGLIKGITGGIGDVVTAAKDMASNFLGGFTDAMGIASPSRVMMDMARHITDGLGVGIKQNENSILNQAKSFVGGLTDVFDVDANLGFGVTGIRSVDSALSGLGNRLKEIAIQAKSFINDLKGIENTLRNLGGRVDQASIALIGGGRTTDNRGGNDSTNNDLTNAVLKAILKLAERDVVVQIDEKEIIRATAPGMSRELQRSIDKNRRGRGY